MSHPVPDRTPRLLRLMKSHPVVIVLAAIVAVLTAVSTVMGLFAQVGAAVSPEPLAAVRFTEDQLENKADGRYDFKFVYPIGWVREDPLNGDGYTFRDPKDRDVLMRAYGSNYVGSSYDFSTYPAELEDGIRDAGQNIELSTYDGAQLTHRDASGDTSSVRDTAGWRLQYTIPSTSTAPEIRVLSRVVFAGDHIVTIEAQAPADDWDRWSPEFSRLEGMLEVRSG